MGNGFMAGAVDEVTPVVRRRCLPVKRRFESSPAEARTRRSSSSLFWQELGASSLLSRVVRREPGVQRLCLAP